MRRYKIAACILLILSVFSFVLAAPVAVQDVREACADAVDGGPGENVIIGSGKRADVQLEDDPLLAPRQYPGSSSAPKYTHPNPSFPSEGLAQLIQSPGTSTEIQPATSGKAKSVSWGPSKEVLLSSGGIYSEMLPPKIKPPPPPPAREGYQPKMAAQQLPSPLKSQSENIVHKLVGKVKFTLPRRFSGTAGGVVTEG